MRIKLILFIPIIIIIFMFNACKDSGTDPGPNGGTPVADSSYFPTTDGAYYKYNIERTDSNGTQTGTRSSFYNGTEVIGTTTYQVQIDSLLLTGQAEIIDSMYFRKSEINSGIFYYLDTTGLASSVPGLDTLLQYITLDTEMRIMLFPVYNNSNWTVFKMNLNLPPLQPFNPVELKASFDGEETLNLNLNPPREVETVRLKFTLNVKTDPFQPTRVYTAFGWVASGIGFVKWQGNGTIVGVFTGNGVDFDDTTSVYTQSITHFNLIDN